MDSVMFRGIIYIIVFVAGFAAGGLFPSFSSQYHQRLQAQYEQVNMDLAPFEKIADKYHNGDMNALVQHHLNSTDPTFFAEGEAIQMMLDSQARLAASQMAADAPYHEQLTYFYTQVDENIARATLESFTPGMITTRDALTFSLGIAGLCILILWLLWNIIAMTVRSLRTTG
ncbi:MAG: DUF2937 family protein [Gammaproteobacteria bacterium]